MNDANSQARQSKGFLSADDLAATIAQQNILLDSSVLISKNAVIGNNNTFYLGTYIFSSVGKVKLGNNNEFGPAGLTIKANLPDALITIGDNGRYCDGASIMGKTNLGSGSQILGNITVQSCMLAAGGTHEESDPDKRAAVLKGFGLARGITLEVGQVVNGTGKFADAPIEWQHAYHPKPQTTA